MAMMARQVGTTKGLVDTMRALVHLESPTFNVYKSDVIRRVLTSHLLAAARRYPVVTLTGPRQSGKTTLCRAAFPRKPYANLERPNVREFARSDPEGFLAQFPRGAVLDEVQRVPELLSYVQVLVDERGRAGEFVLTGSQHFGLLATISQSLAGRMAVLHLLPFSLDELGRASKRPHDLFATLLAGGYPRIHDRGLPPGEWLANYVATYVERDVRQVLNVGDLATFQTFLALAAGRVGQLLNLSGLGADCGVSHPTAKSWLSVLETGFIAFRLRPLHRNLGKRLTKSPKLYFYDSGLVCHLLGIRSAAELRLHPLRGAIFESWAVSEIMKARLHRGLAADLFFYRDFRGSEVDVVVGAGPHQIAVEIKSSETFQPGFLAPLRSFASLMRAARAAPARLESVVVYGGTTAQRRTEAQVIPWSRIASSDWGNAPHAPRRAARAPASHRPSRGSRPGGTRA